MATCRLTDVASTLEEYIAESTKSYDSSRKAIQSQLDSLSSQLAAAEEGINRNFAVQQQNLDDQRQTAASNASMQAAGSGGSFGGRANIANRDYYQQVFVPAVTQLQTNQANALSEARQSSENQRLSLNDQLAQLADQAYSTALSRYDAGQQLAEQQRQYNEQLAWEKEKFAKQLAEQQASRAASSAASSNNAGSYLSQLLNKTSSGLSSYFNKTSGSNTQKTVEPAYVLDAKGNAVYNFATGSGGNPSLQSLLATDPKVMAQIIAKQAKK